MLALLLLGVAVLALSHTAPFPFLFEAFRPSQSIWRIDPRPAEPSIYLTFDDGPNPRMHGAAAVVRFASAAQVHPIIATRWSGRLTPAIVIAANEGFLAGRVNFAIRSYGDVNLLEWVRGLPFTPSPGSEYANGHARATGGSLSAADYERFIDVLRSRGHSGAVQSRDGDRTAPKPPEPRNV